MDLPASIAITGASGFIGSHLVQRLQAAGIEPIQLTRANGFDICDYESLVGAPAFDAVVHLAARTFVPESHQNALPFLTTNVTGTMNVLQACRERNARIVFLSSYVYGKPDRLPIDESHPTGHWNPYASSKLMGEELCHAFAGCFDVPAVILRLFNVYGPGQDERFLIPKIVEGAKQGAITLHSSKPKRDFVHVRDVVEAIVCALGCERGLHTFNVGSGASYSVRDVVQYVVDARKSNCDVQPQPITVKYSEQERPNEVMDVVADCSRIQRELGWGPHIDLQTGLAQLALSDD